MSRRPPSLAFLGVVLIVTAADAAGPAKSKPAAQSATKAEAGPLVAAVVGEQPVYVAEVDDLLAGLRRKTAGGASAELRAAALEQSIHQRLVAQYLVKQGYAVDKHEGDELLGELKRKLKTQGLTFDEFLSRHGLHESMVRRRLEWDVMWAGFLANETTDEALQRFFELHHRDYDGSELRVSHILLRVKPEDGEAKLGAALEQADKLRSQIVSGKLSFAKAAEQHSSGPSRRQGGDLGFIPLHDRMTEAFSRAAFALHKGEISKPVVDQFGVHLIQCTDVKAGEKTWQDARRELVEDFAREKFLELAKQQRKKIAVKIVDR